MDTWLSINVEGDEWLRVFPGNGNPRDEELAWRRKENSILQRGAGYPAKSGGHLLKTEEMRFRYMEEQRGSHSVETDGQGTSSIMGGVLCLELKRS